MKKRVFIIHGWAGFPEEEWFQRLKGNLEEKGYAVHIPQLPDARYPRIEKWIPVIENIVEVPDQQTYFVGHSLGCQAIIRYLELLPPNTKIGGVIFVAGFILPPIGAENDPRGKELLLHWIGTPPDYQKVRTHISQCSALFSDDDPAIGLENRKEFEEKLNAQIITLHNKGHFTKKYSGVEEIPEVFIELQKMAQIGQEIDLPNY